MVGTSPRHQRLLDALSEKGELSVAQLGGQLGVCEMTVRRDLAQLEKAGRLERTWGGARAGERHLIDFTFRGKVRKHGKEKEAIGRAAAELVPEGATVIVDTGTTALQVARALRGRTGLRVLTCSLPIVAELLDCPGIITDMLGGTVRAESLELYGPLTERNFGGLRADIAFLGADAVGEDGWLYTTSMETGRVAELMVQTARRRVLVADASKWGAKATVRYAPIVSLTTAISDSRLGERQREAFRSAGVELVIV
jgi:DeoR/GlpR family transcriptional regulator of sugar metabolism